MSNATIGIITASMVIGFLAVVLIYILVNYYLHYGFSSGNWYNKKGDVVVVRNRGILGKSQLKIGALDTDKYDVVDYKCRMLINPLSLPHKFTMYVLGDDKLTATINMLTGKMKLYKDGIFYDEFSKLNN